MGYQHRNKTITQQRAHLEHNRGENRNVVVFHILMIMYSIAKNNNNLLTQLVQQVRFGQSGAVERNAI